MKFNQRSLEKELLDGINIPFKEIALNMQELNTINRILGGHQITITGFKHILRNRKTISVCEIGSGGGDNLVAIVKWCAMHGIQVNCIGIDMNEACIAFAKKNPTLLNNTAFICSNYSTVVFEKKPDILFSSLFCHHFSDEDLQYQLNWMQKNSTMGCFINDLHRHWLAYFSIKYLAQIFSKSYLLKNDAPLSVARGFTKREWVKLFKIVGITNYTIQWKWAFRHLIIFKNPL